MKYVVSLNACVGETCFIDNEVTVAKRDQMTFFIQIAS